MLSVSTKVSKVIKEKTFTQMTLNTCIERWWLWPGNAKNTLRFCGSILNPSQPSQIFALDNWKYCIMILIIQCFEWYKKVKYNPDTGYSCKTKEDEKKEKLFVKLNSLMCFHRTLKSYSYKPQKSIITASDDANTFITFVVMLWAYTHTYTLPLHTHAHETNYML